MATKIGIEIKLDNQKDALNAYLIIGFEKENEGKFPTPKFNIVWLNT